MRLWLPSASGRKRHNVLGAYDPVTHEAITVTNDTYINQDVFCEFLDKIANAYASSGRPITLLLDNARYQKCQSVANKAKELNIELLYLPPYSPNLNLLATNLSRDILKFQRVAYNSLPSFPWQRNLIHVLN